MFKILIVEDDKNLRYLMKKVVQKEGYDVLEATNGVEALDIIDQNYVDLIVSDIMMPQMDGIELLEELREAKFEIPFILVTAKAEFSDKKHAYDIGADDYLVKPIDINELVLKIQALLKRSNKVNEKKITIGKLELDYSNLSVKYKGQTIFLANKEFYLLYKLVSAKNNVINREDLMEEIWGYDSQSDYRTIDVHIKRLRQKLKDVDEISIETVRGVGYRVNVKEL